MKGEGIDVSNKIRYIDHGLRSLPTCRALASNPNHIISLCNCAILYAQELNNPKRGQILSSMFSMHRNTLFFIVELIIPNICLNSQGSLRKSSGSWSKKYFCYAQPGHSSQRFFRHIFRMWVSAHFFIRKEVRHALLYCRRFWRCKSAVRASTSTGSGLCAHPLQLCEFDGNTPDYFDSHLWLTWAWPRQSVDLPFSFSCRWLVTHNFSWKKCFGY